MGYNIRFKNSNYLCHKSHKYIDKKWSHGRWNYIYEEAKNKLGIGTADKVSNARDESRRANYVARKATNELNGRTAMRQYLAKRLDPSNPTAPHYEYTLKAERKAAMDADAANRYAKEKKAELEKAKQNHENSFAAKAGKTISSLFSSAVSSIKQAGSTMQKAVNKGKEAAEGFAFITKLVGLKAVVDLHDHGKKFMEQTVGVGAKERADKAQADYDAKYARAKNDRDKFNSASDTAADKRMAYDNMMGPKSQASTTQLNIAKQQRAQAKEAYRNSVKDMGVAYWNNKRAQNAYSNTWAGKIDNTLKKAKKRFGF